MELKKALQGLIIARTTYGVSPHKIKVHCQAPKFSTTHK